jgi:hypothetical protein
MSKFGAEDVIIIPYTCLSQERARRVEEYCLSLDPTVDSGETACGATSTLAWIHYHNFELDPSAPFFGTLCMFSRTPDGPGSFLGMVQAASIHYKTVDNAPFTVFF